MHQYSDQKLVRIIFIFSVHIFNAFGLAVLSYHLSSFVVYMSVAAIALYYGITLSQERWSGFITFKFKG